MVTTWSAPEAESRSATSLQQEEEEEEELGAEPYLAMMGVLGLSTLSALAKG